MSLSSPNKRTRNGNKSGGSSSSSTRGCCLICSAPSSLSLDHRELKFALDCSGLPEGEVETILLDAEHVKGIKFCAEDAKMVKEGVEVGEMVKRLGGMLEAKKNEIREAFMSNIRRDRGFHFIRNKIGSVVLDNNARGVPIPNPVSSEPARNIDPGLNHTEMPMNQNQVIDEPGNGRLGNPGRRRRRRVETITLNDEEAEKMIESDPDDIFIIENSPKRPLLPQVPMVPSTSVPSLQPQSQIQTEEVPVNAGNDHTFSSDESDDSSSSDNEQTVQRGAEPVAVPSQSQSCPDTVDEEIENENSRTRPDSTSSQSVESKRCVCKLCPTSYNSIAALRLHARREHSDLQKASPKGKASRRRSPRTSGGFGTRTSKSPSPRKRPTAEPSFEQDARHRLIRRQPMRSTARTASPQGERRSVTRRNTASAVPNFPPRLLPPFPPTPPKSSRSQPVLLPRQRGRPYSFSPQNSGISPNENIQRSLEELVPGKSRCFSCGTAFDSSYLLNRHKRTCDHVVF